MCISLPSVVRVFRTWLIPAVREVGAQSRGLRKGTLRVSHVSSLEGGAEFQWTGKSGDGTSVEEIDWAPEAKRLEKVWRVQKKKVNTDHGWHLLLCFAGF